MRLDPNRLEQLQRLSILDSPPERAFDDITRALAASLGLPIVMINLLDAQRDWFKSCVGLQLAQSPVITSFCEKIFGTGDDLLVVEDTLADSRFAEHPFVAGRPYIRFYAAARLVVRGHTVGTLCGYDVTPRRLALFQLDQLRATAGAVVNLLERRLPSG